VVGVKNPFAGGLTTTQVKDISTGKITSWSEVGGSAATIQVINRSLLVALIKVFVRKCLQGGNLVQELILK
jgi:phosphate transport system substrate-binding protein